MSLVMTTNDGESIVYFRLSKGFKRGGTNEDFSSYLDDTTRKDE